MPAFNNRSVVSGQCPVGSVVNVSVWVGDALHNQGEPYEEDTRSVTVRCLREWR